MNTILLVTSDLRVEQRFKEALRFDERLQTQKTTADLPRIFDNDRYLTVLDHRETNVAQLHAEIAQVRGVVGPSVGIIVLSGGPHVGPFEIIATIGNRAREVILGDLATAPFLVRAELNDPSRSGAPMIALHALTSYLPSGAHIVPCEILGSGLRYSLAKQLAVLWEEDPGTIRRHLDGLGYDTHELAQLSIASLAVVLLRTTSLPINKTAKLAGYSRTSKFDTFLVRVLGMSAAMIRDDAGPASPEEWLRIHLPAAHAAATERRKETEARKRETRRRKRTGFPTITRPRKRRRTPI